MLKNIRFLPAVEMTNLPNPTFYESIKVNKGEKYEKQSSCIND